MNLNHGRIRGPAVARVEPLTGRRQRPADQRRGVHHGSSTTRTRSGRPTAARSVRREIEASGTYWHAPEELAFGARVAWRNSSRCIGGSTGASLRVRDRREVHAAPAVAAESVAHLREATNGGRIRPVITVFAPDAPGRPGPRILSSQLVRYAGYRTADGAVLGDPANVDMTRLPGPLGLDRRPPARAAGSTCSRCWCRRPARPRRGTSCRRRDPGGADRHPEFGWFAELGLRWYAVPVISDMYLEIGGVRYPAAPFNGWYMCTEIGSRDLGDAVRYAQLPVIAAHMGLPLGSERNLWKDRAMTELNVAVLHSFAAAGVTITDHHTESAAPGRHRRGDNPGQSPNFYRHEAPARVTELVRGDAAAQGPGRRPSAGTVVIGLCRGARSTREPLS